MVELVTRTPSKPDETNKSLTPDLAAPVLVNERNSLTPLAREDLGYDTAKQLKDGTSVGILQGSKHGLDEENPAEYANCIMLCKSSIDQPDAEELVVDKIPLEDTEAISNSTFRNLIEDAVKENSAVILARLQTRDKADFRKKYFHHFYGPNLVKILFRVFDLPG